MIKVSIVTICYNNKNDIRPTIESVLSQSYPNIEYIIKDGGSNDGTIDVINEYKERINKIITGSDNGLYDAINIGIKASSGEIVGMIHAGDRLYDNHVIEDIARFFENNDVDIMYGHSRIVNSSGKTKRLNISPDYNKRLVRKGWMPSHQSIYVRRELFEKFGYYTMNVGGSGDYEWFIKYFYVHADNLKIKLNDRFIVRFYLGGQSTINLASRGKKKNRDRLKQCWLNNGVEPPFALPYMKLFRTLRMMVRAKMDRNNNE